MKKFNIYWLYLIILVVLGGIFFMHDDSQTKDVSWTEFEGYVVKGGVKNIVVTTDKPGDIFCPLYSLQDCLQAACRVT